jgi:hypothetical protein
MLPSDVIVLDPGQKDLLCFLARFELVQPDTFLFQGAEKPLHDAVILGRASGDELLGDAQLARGGDEMLGQENGAVIVSQPQTGGPRSEATVVMDHGLLQGINGLERAACPGKAIADTLTCLGSCLLCKGVSIAAAGCPRGCVSREPDRRAAALSGNG